MQRSATFGKSKKVLSDKEVIERLKKVERAVELKVLDKPQAEVDGDIVSNVKTLLVASKGIDVLIVHLGSLILVKYPNEDNKTVVITRNLSQDEMIKIKENLDDPDSYQVCISEIINYDLNLSTNDKNVQLNMLET